MSTYYVSTATATPAGSDAAAGSLAAPWLTLAKVYAVALAGDTIIIRGGASIGSPFTYAGALMYTNATHKNFFFQNYTDEHVKISDQTNSQMLIMEGWSAGGWSVIGSGSITFGPSKAPPAAPHGFLFDGAVKLSNCSNIVMDGGPNRQMFFKSGSFMGLLLDLVTTDCTIQNFQATDNAYGVMFNGNSTRAAATTSGQRCIFQDFDSYDNRRLASDNSGTANTDAGATGINLKQCDGVTVRRFTSHGNYAVSVQYGMDGGLAEFFGAINCTYSDFIGYDNNGGIETGTQSTAPLDRYNVIRRGTIYGSMDLSAGHTVATSVFILRSWQDGILENCTVYVSNAKYICDVYVEATDAYAGLADRGIVRNNIFAMVNPVSTEYNARFGSITALVSTFSADYNLYYRLNGTSATPMIDRQGTIKTLAQVQTEAIFEVNGKYGDPRFIDPSTAVANFRLGGGSAARDAGLYVGLPSSGRPDMGAIEAARSGRLWL